MRTETADGTFGQLSDSFGRADDAQVKLAEAGHFTRKSKQRRRYSMAPVQKNLKSLSCGFDRKATKMVP